MEEQIQKWRTTAVSKKCINHMEVAAFNHKNYSLVFSCTDFSNIIVRLLNFIPSCFCSKSSQACCNAVSSHRRAQRSRSLGRSWADQAAGAGAQPASCSLLCSQPACSEPGRACKRFAHCATRAFPWIRGLTRLLPSLLSPMCLILAMCIAQMFSARFSF